MPMRVACTRMAFFSALMTSATLTRPSFTEGHWPAKMLTIAISRHVIRRPILSASRHPCPLA